MSFFLAYGVPLEGAYPKPSRHSLDPYVLYQALRQRLKTSQSPEEASFLAIAWTRRLNKNEADLIKLRDKPVYLREVMGLERVGVYLKPSKKKKYEVVFLNGKIYSARTLLPLSTQDKHLFVYTEEGRFYSMKDHGGRLSKLRNHASFTCGKPVRFAGEWLVDKGVLQWISNKSGHYRPTLPHFAHFLKFLHLEKKCLEEAKVELCRKTPATACETQ